LRVKVSAISTKATPWSSLVPLQTLYAHVCTPGGGQGKGGCWGHQHKSVPRVPLRIIPLQVRKGRVCGKVWPRGVRVEIGKVSAISTRAYLWFLCE